MFIRPLLVLGICATAERRRLRGSGSFEDSTYAGGSKGFLPDSDPMLPDTFKQIARQTGTRFVGKVILITGGTSGIGFHTAAAAYQECATVIVAGRNSAAGALAVRVIRALPRAAGCPPPEPESGTGKRSPPPCPGTGGGVEYYQVDVRHPKQLRAMLDAVGRRHGGKIDAAVLAAGIPGTLTRFGAEPYADWLTSEEDRSSADPIYNNLYGTMFSAKELLRFWARTGANASTTRPKAGTGTSGGVGGGLSIVTVSSQDGLDAGSEWYGTSKHGIIGFTAAAAATYGGYHNNNTNINDKNNSTADAGTARARVRFNSVAPGMVDTPFTWNQAALYDPANQGRVTQIGQCIARGRDRGAGSSGGERGVVIDGACPGGGTGFSCPCPDVARADAHRVFAAVGDRDPSDPMGVVTLPGVVLPPAAIAERILFLASDEAGELGISGQTYYVSNYPAGSGGGGAAGGDRVCSTSYLARGCTPVAGVAEYAAAVKDGRMCANC